MDKLPATGHQFEAASACYRGAYTGITPNLVPFLIWFIFQCTPEELADLCLICRSHVLPKTREDLLKKNVIVG